MEQRQHLQSSSLCASAHSLLYNPVLWVEHRGPLEVIYEEHEAEEDDGVDSPPGAWQSPGRDLSQGSEGVDLLGLGFCTHGSDSLRECSGVVSLSPQWDSPENMCFLWEMEEEGLIEISLEEDTLIEIDLSVCR